MKITRKGKRLLLLALALLLIVAAVPGIVLASNARNTADYSSHKDGTAKFNIYEYALIYIADDPTKGWGNNTLDPAKYGDLVMIIDEVYVGNGGLWYKVKAAQGHTLPSELVSYPWIYQNDVPDMGYYKDALIVTPPAEEPGNPLDKIVVEGIPEGAVVEAEDLSDIMDDDSNSGIYDIKVKDENGNYWQPTPGETVKVSIPAPAGAETVTVVHFLEDPEIIKYMLDNNLLEAVDISFLVDAEDYLALEPAVIAYQQATGTDSLCFVPEIFENVAVINGVATVDANGFSVFTSYPPNAIVENTNAFNNLPSTVYVRPGEWIRCSVSGFIATIDVETDNSKIAQKVSGSDFAFIGTSDTYIHVSASATAGQNFEINAFCLIPWLNKTVKFIVVDDFDYGDVHICLLPETNSTFTNPASTYTGSEGLYFYSNSGTLGNANAKTIYNTSPASMIKVSDVETNGTYDDPDLPLVLGIYDAANADNFVTADFNALKDDIIAKFCAKKKIAADRYHYYELDVLAIRQELVGNNDGWYIICKVNYTADYKITYNPNYPDTRFDPHSFTAGDAMPVEQTVQTNNQTTVTTNILGNKGMEMQEKTEDGTGTDTATFVCWSTDPLATAEEANKNKNNTVEDKYYFPGEQITLTGNVKLYAVWNLDFDFDIADIQYVCNVTDEDGNIVSDSSKEFAFIADAKLESLTYQKYNGGIAVGNPVTFGADVQSRTFTLKNGEYIIISDVPIEKASVTFTTSEYIGFSADTEKAVRLNTETATYRVIHVFERETYQIAYDLTDDNNVTGTNHADNPTTYTVESGKIVLKDPTPPDGYKFVGWAEGNTIDSGSAGEKTFTAIWEPALTSLTITVSGWEAIDMDQAFLFRIEGNGVNMVVSARGENPVVINGLTIGETYTVIAKDTWSWRYDVAIGGVRGDNNITIPEGGIGINAGTLSVQFELGADGTITFTMARVEDQWLDGNGYYSGN